MLFFVKWKYLLKATRTCARCVHCWRRRRNVGSSELQDIMTKYNEVNCVGKKTHRDGGVREPEWSGCTRSVQWRGATNLEVLTLTNFPERDDVQWMKHMLPS